MEEQRGYRSEPAVARRAGPAKRRLPVVLWVFAATAIVLGSLNLTGMVYKRQPAEPTDPDEVVLVVSQTIGPDGGILSAGHTGSPIDGAVIEIPPGALGDEDTISLGYSRGKVKIRAGVGSGVILVLAAEHTRSFDKHVSIKVPFDPSKSTDLVIPYEVDDEGGLHVMDIGNIDWQNHVLTIYTFKPVKCTWVYP